MFDATATPEAAPAEAVASTAVPVTAAPVADASLMAAAAAPAGPARPDGLPDAFWDDATGVKPEAYSRLAELEAQVAARSEGVPASASEYTLEPAEPVLGPDGQAVSADPEDPLLIAALPVLHKHGVPQAAISEILAEVLKSQVADAAEINKANEAFVAGELAKLGTAHKERTSALHNQVIAAVGADHAEALRLQMRSAGAVVALENLVSKLQGPALAAKPSTPPAMPDLATRLYG